MFFLKSYVSIYNINTIINGKRRRKYSESDFFESDSS
jgi:hypothetical protein